MAAKKKISDNELIEVIKKNPNGSMSSIAEAAGLTRGGYTYKRIEHLRSIVNAEILDEPTLTFSEIQENDRLLRAGKRLVVITADRNYILVRRMDGSTETISRVDFSNHAAEYSKVPHGDPQGGPVTTYYIPPGTEPGDIEIDGTAIKDMSEEDKQKIIDSFTNGLNGGPSLDQSPRPGSGGNGSDTKPPLFEEVDYIDPEWGVTEQTTGRDYMDRINQLLDIMAPECRKTPLLKMDVMTIAISMLNRGFDKEVRDA